MLFVVIETIFNKKVKETYVTLLQKLNCSKLLTGLWMFNTRYTFLLHKT